MKNKRDILKEIPIRNPEISWRLSDGEVILEIQNVGIFNKLAQLILKKPKSTQVHLDDIGGCVWENINGKNDFSQLAFLLQKKFNEKVFPLNERLLKYLTILESYGFIYFKNKGT